MAGASHTAHLHAQEEDGVSVSRALCASKNKKEKVCKPANEGFDAFSSDGCHAHGHGLG